MSNTIQFAKQLSLFFCPHYTICINDTPCLANTFSSHTISLSPCNLVRFGLEDCTAGTRQCSQMQPQRTPGNAAAGHFDVVIHEMRCPEAGQTIP